MTSAHDHSGLKHPRDFFIEGDWVKPSGTDVFDLIQPHTEETYGCVSLADESNADRAVSAARQAFDQGPWPRMTHAERGGYLRKIAAGIRQRADAFANVWTNETGVISTIARQGTQSGADRFDYYAGLADSFAFVESHTPSVGGGTAFL